MDPTPRVDHTLYRLMSWLSPSYPVGVFSYSHGLEWVVEIGEIHDAESLGRWVEGIVRHGGGWADAMFFAHAWRAAHDESDEALGHVAEEAAAFASAKERRLETCAQGDAFVSVSERAWPCEALARLRSAWDGSVAYPVAVAVTAAGHGVPLVSALVAMLHTYASNLVTAGARLIPLGDMDPQRIVAGLMPTIEQVARRAEARALADHEGAAILHDIAAVRREEEYAGPFRA